MEELELLDRVITINRTAKVVKGGRRFRFSAIVVVGDGKGSVGAGLGKAHEVPEAIRKGMEQAKKTMTKVAVENRTIPYSVIGHFGAGKVLLEACRGRDRTDRRRSGEGRSGSGGSAQYPDQMSRIS